MGYFDPITQRRTENVEEAVLLPVAETEAHLHPQGTAGLCEDLRAIIARQQRRKTPNQALIDTLQKDCEALENETLFASADRYMALIYPELHYGRRVFVAGGGRRVLRPRESAAGGEGKGGGIRPAARLVFDLRHAVWRAVRFYGSIEDLAAQLRGRAVVYCDGFLAARYPESLPPKKLLSFTARQLPGYGGSLETAASDLKNYTANQYGSIVLCGGQRRGEILKDLLAQNGLNALLAFPLTKLPQPGQILLAPGSLPAGLEYPTLKFAILTEGQIAVRQERKKTRAQKKATNRKKLDSLHRPHARATCVRPRAPRHRPLRRHGAAEGGRRRPRTTSRSPMQGTDCAVRPGHAAGSGQQVYRRRRGHAGAASTSWAATHWQKTKARAKAAAKDLAAGLIKLYAERKRLPGYRLRAGFARGSRSLRSSFEYAETDDQLRCIDEIKRDMEKPVAHGPAALRRRGLRQDGGGPARGHEVHSGRQAGGHPGAHHGAGPAALSHGHAPLSRRSRSRSTCSRASARRRRSERRSFDAAVRQDRPHHRHAQAAAEGRPLQGPGPADRGRGAALRRRRTRSG